MEPTTQEREEFYRGMIAALVETADIRQLKTIIAYIQAFLQ